jgi:crotonobetainyl-CoA:carnitine CoA-transferase CaiB-like acyl-CoA transferase
MNKVLEGIRVLEVAQYVFVPIATGVLSEWGAEVIKIEHPVTGDAYRGLRSSGALAVSGPVNYAIQHANRGKKSVGIDLANPEGRKVLDLLIAEADVFVTNMLPGVRQRLHIEVEDVRKANPKIIYARGSALGVHGPEAKQGGFDSSIFWARTGAGLGATPQGGQFPSPMPSPAFGDTLGGLVLAGGIAAAIAGRERTGDPSIVDLSLLGLGCWGMGSAVAGSLQAGTPWASMERVPATNALAGNYRTSDGRFISITLLKGFYEWAELCRSLDRPDLVSDARFDTPDKFVENTQHCVALLDEIFGSETLEEWCRRLADFKGVWSPFQNSLEIAADRQTVANGHVQDVDMGDGSALKLVANPIQFDEEPNKVRRAPEAGEHTEEALLDLGIAWDEIAALKRKGAIQ